MVSSRLHIIPMQGGVSRELALPLAPSGWCLVWALPGLNLSIRSTLELYIQDSKQTHIIIQAVVKYQGRILAYIYKPTIHMGKILHFRKFTKTLGWLCWINKQ